MTFPDNDTRLAMKMNDVYKKYWDDIPDEMKVELIAEKFKKKEIIEFAAEELDLDIHLEGHNFKKKHLTQFVLSVLDKYSEVGS